MSSEVEIRAPAEQTEGTRSQILRWLKAVGESVTENEPLIELETDKVTVEVPSPGSGTLREILKQEQDEIGPGELLGRIEADGAVSGKQTPVTAAATNDGVTAAATAALEGASDAGVPAFAATSLSPAVRRLLAERGLEASDVRGSGQGGRVTVADVLAHGTIAGSGGTGATHAAADGAWAGRGAGGPGPTRSAAGNSPSAMKSAHVPADGASVAHGPADVAADSAVVGEPSVGRGAGGHLGRSHSATGNSASAGRSAHVPADGASVDHGPADIAADGAVVGEPSADRGAGGHLGPSHSATGDAASAVKSAHVPADGASVAHGPADIAAPSRLVPHTATRKRIAEHMVQSLLHTAPHVTTVFEADLTAVLEHRQRNKDDFSRRGAPLTLTAYFLQATVAAIRAVPEANSRWTDSALEVFESMHIGVATALETGLVVPVLRDVQSRDLFETAKGLDELVSRARDGHLTPPDVRGGTFTISNHGVSGSLVATPIIINQPQSAILGVGKLEKRPVVVTSDDGEDRIVIRPRCYVTLTIDHRVMDGHQANRFLQTFLEHLDAPK
jgi:pyruvate/2-oxoglutarate dehydrogenase complex dihydrolipoamide acyltransferase (E2) component